MNDLYYENQGTTTYLVCKVEQEDDIDSMSLGMLTNNKIPGLAPTFFMQMDNERYIKFNVSAKVSLSQLFSGTVNRRQLLGAFRGIVDAMSSAEAYMLECNSILLNLDYIFIDVSTCETVLICLPLEKEITEETKSDMCEFLRNIMFSIQFDQTENCEHVAKIINYLNGTTQFSLQEFKKVIEEQISTDTQPAPMVEAVHVQQAFSQQEIVSQPIQPQPIQPQPIQPQPIQPQPIPEKKETSNSKKTKEKKQVKSKKEQAQPEENMQTDADAPEMTFMYLMQHYSKENKAIYDAQKETKKQSGKTSAKQQNNQTVKESKVEVAEQNSNLGFVIPGVDPTQGALQQPIPKATEPKKENSKTKEKASKGKASKKQVTQQAAPIEANVKQQVPVTGQQVPVTGQQVPVTGQQVPVTGQQIPVASQQSPMGDSLNIAVDNRTINYSETTVLASPSASETTVLVSGQFMDQSAVVPFLIRRKNNEKVYVNKPVFRIGKERSYADYFISDNKAISRSHANIVNHDGEYFIVDTNSTNHTYLNGEMIQSNVEVKLSHGDAVRLANDDFEFKFY